MSLAYSKQCLRYQHHVCWFTEKIRCPGDKPLTWQEGIAAAKRGIELLEQINQTVESENEEISDLTRKKHNEGALRKTREWMKELEAEIEGAAEIPVQKRGKALQEWAESFDVLTMKFKDK
jgi:hypothetical protein